MRAHDEEVTLPVARDSTIAYSPPARLLNEVGSRRRLRDRCCDTSARLERRPKHRREIYVPVAVEIDRPDLVDRRESVRLLR